MSPAPAQLPPAGLPGLDPRWSRLVTAPDGAKVSRTWHLLDNGPVLEQAGIHPTGTILCVHGNPTWSYLWRSVVGAATEAALDASAAGAGGLTDAGADGHPPTVSRRAWRVIAVDQLEMGFSERTTEARGLPRRIADLSALTDALELRGPVVTFGHDWGGVVSLGWAVDHPELLAGVMLLNTAIHQPEQFALPAALRLVLKRSLLVTSTVRTTAFLDVTLGLAHPKLAPDVRHAFASPYLTAARRRGIGGFVADIPVDASHPSFAELERVADGVRALGRGAEPVPALMLWGPNDPVFSDRYLGDLIDRMPHADVTRFEGASHLVGEDVAVAPIALDWLAERLPAGADEPERLPAPLAADDRAPAAGYRPLWAALDQHAGSRATAVVDMAPRGAARAASGPRIVSWQQLSLRVREIAAGLTAVGVEAGHRVSLLVPPGADLTAVVYACLRIGAVVVVADAGLGVKGLSRAVRGSRPDHVVGIETALVAARALGWPGQKISVRTLPKAIARGLGVSRSLPQIAKLGRDVLASPSAVGFEPAPDDIAAVLFTSGSTGPAKGVVYTHRQLAALVTVLQTRFAIGIGTGLVAGFAPFALLGPALGATSVTPDMDVTSPRTLTATAIADAAAAVDASIVFASPAALTNVVATARDLTLAQRRTLSHITTLLSAGAPLPTPLLECVQLLVPEASIHTPYGMTEGLLMTDITLAEILAAQTDDAALDASAGGVCVGEPVSSAAGDVEVRISALDAEGRATGEPSADRGVTGEIIVSAPHLKLRYDQLWLTDREAARDTPGSFTSDSTPEKSTSGLHSPQRWHRTGDVGHLDARGRLWVEGRLPHVITTASGILTPVRSEQAIEALPGVRRAAVIGVGPRGTQQVVAVIETDPRVSRVTQASAELSEAVRNAVQRATGHALTAVLLVPDLPTDVRHNSKIDRSALGEWAAGILAGGRRRAP